MSRFARGLVGMSFVSIMLTLWWAPVWAQNPFMQGTLTLGQYSSTGFSFIDTPKGKGIAALMKGGLPFSPSPMKVRGKLSEPNVIVIEAFDSEKNLLLPSKDSIVPLEFDAGFPGGQPSAGLKARVGVPYTHAANTTWKFAKPEITFEANGLIYRSKRPGATIRFTSEGVKMDGIKVGKK